MSLKTERDEKSKKRGGRRHLYVEKPVSRETQRAGGWATDLSLTGSKMLRCLALPPRKYHRIREYKSSEDDSSNINLKQAQLMGSRSTSSKRGLRALAENGKEKN